MKRIILLSAVFFCTLIGTVSAANVTDFGTNGNDDTKAFVQVLSFADCAEVPPGEYYLKSLSVPENKKIIGDAENPPILHVLGDDSEYLFDMKSGSEISNVRIVNDAGKEQAIHIENASDVTLSEVEISGFDYGVYNDHGDNMICDGMKIHDIENTGITTIFASGIKVRNSIVQNCKNHGIQFWNNWEGERRGGDLLYENNTVIDIGNGGIWGSGGTNVIMRNNTVDNCGDVGLDMEYVKTGEIYQNTVMRCANGGISCFMTCDGVKIYNNRIYNNRPVYGVNDYMAGIWLTYENSKYAYDTGNKNIDIYDNFIYCITDNGGHNYTREAIRICTRNYNEKNITVSNNIILGIPYRILFDISGGTQYGYDENMSFNADGTEYSITSDNENESQGQYKNRCISYCNADITTEKSFSLKNIVKESGAAEVCFYLTKNEMSSDAAVLIEIINEDSGEVITSDTLSSDRIGKTSLYYDRSATDNVIFKVSATGTYADVKLDRIDVNMADFIPFVFIDTIDGLQFLNNSYCNLKTKLVFRKPENGLGIKSYITVTNHSSNSGRQSISASRIDSE